MIAHGPDRAAAIATLADALDELRLEGVESNLDLLAAVVAEPAFRAGDLHTGFLEEHRIVEGLRDIPPEAVAAAAAWRSLGGVWSRKPVGRRSSVAPRAGSGSGRGGSRAASPWRRSSTSTTRPGRHASRSATPGSRSSCGTDGRGRGDARCSGTARSASAPRPAAGVVDTVTIAGGRTGCACCHRRRATTAPRLRSAGGAITAPMPGRIVRINVAAGDDVAATQPLIVLEAMKMEHVIVAPSAGRVARLLVAVGDQVTRGEALAELAADGVEPTPTPERGA